MTSGEEAPEGRGPSREPSLPGLPSRRAGGSTDAVVVGSIGGLVHANIDASWLLVPMISGTRASVPARAASIGWCGSRSTP